MSEKEKRYSVPESILTAIADRVRAMTGNTELLSLEKIVYDLGRIRYIPQGIAKMEVPAGAIAGEAEGMIPIVQKGIAESSCPMAIIETSAM